MKKIIFLIIMAALFSCLTGCRREGGDDVFNQANTGKYLSPPVMETENGFYYIKMFDFSLKSEMHFYDKETGKDIVLCNKPECPHDGNPFCAATNDDLLVYAALYKDYVYTVRLLKKEDIVSTKLYRSSLDGTELTELATIDKAKGKGVSWGNYSPDYMVIYNDRIYLQYQGGREDSWADLGLAVVDLNNHSVKCLDVFSSEDYSGHKKPVPYGDYIYYYVSKPFFGENRTIYRYNIKTDKKEALKIEGNWRDYCIVDGRVIFLRCDEDGFLRLYSLDPESMETKALTDKLINDKGESILDYPEMEGYIIYDGEHIIISGGDNYSAEYLNYVYSKTGELLAVFHGPEYSENKLDTDDIVGLNKRGDVFVSGGNVFIVNYYEAIYCPMKDILAGNVHWKQAYKIHDIDEDSEADSDENADNELD